jgi:hypothetical protein
VRDANRNLSDSILEHPVWILPRTFCIYSLFRLFFSFSLNTILSGTSTISRTSATYKFIAVFTYCPTVPQYLPLHPGVLQLLALLTLILPIHTDVINTQGYSRCWVPVGLLVQFIEWPQNTQPSIFYYRFGVVANKVLRRVLRSKWLKSRGFWVVE